MSTSQPEPAGRRESAHPEPVELPDFLKQTTPPRQRPNAARAATLTPTDPAGAAHEAAREWLAHLAAGRIGPKRSV